MFSSRVEKILKIPPEQQLRTGMLFVFSFGMTGAYIGARSDADAFFLSRIGVERLPAMILISASGVAIVTALYTRTLARLSLQRVVSGTHLVLALITLTLGLMLNTNQQTVGIPAGLYLLAELRGTLGSIQFATLLNELFRSNAPARVSGTASSGSTISAVILGSLIGWLATRFGATSVLYVIVVMDATAGFAALRCRRTQVAQDDLDDEERHVPQPPETDNGENEMAPASPIAILKQVPLARYLAGIVCLKTIIVLLIEYEWKSTAVSNFPSENELASFFGIFYASTAMLTGSLQLFGTSRFLTRYGVHAGLAAFPGSVTLALSTVFFVVKPQAMFWCLTITRGCDVLRRGLTDTALNVLYWPLGPALRRRVIAMNGGWIKPLSEAFAAVLLFPLTATLSSRGLAFAITSLCLVWLFVTYRRSRTTPEPTSGNIEPGNI